MRKQRNMFLGEVPEKSPKKHGQNRPVPERRFEALSPNQIDIGFTDTTVTQFGGYPLWDSFLGELKLDLRLAQRIKMDRGEGFTAPEVSRWFIDTRFLGAQRLMDVDPMRCDPMLTQAYGIDTLPSDETVGRYFKSYTKGNLDAADRLNTDVNNRCWHAARKHNAAIQDGAIILDYDSSTMTVYGAQEGADRGRSFRKKDKPGFQPKFAFIGGLGIMVNQHLYPQSVSLPKHFEQFHDETVAKLPEGARIWAIRGDGALYSEDRAKWCETQGYTYGISAAMTSHLRNAVAQIPEADWVESTDTQLDEYGRPYSVARITYKPATWEAARTYIISRRLKDNTGQQALIEGEQYKYFAYVTDFEGAVLEQYKFCVERCSLESFIKETKHGFHYEHLPHKKLDANRAYLAHVQMAYNLVIWFKMQKTPRGVNRWTIKTLRQRVVNICGNLKRRAGGWVLTLPKWWPWQSTYREIAMACGLSPP